MSIYLTEEQAERWEATKLGYPPEEWRQWKMEHVTIFNHVPSPNFKTGEPCDHPMHLAIARAMNEDKTDHRWEQIPHHTTHTEDDAEIDPRFGSREYIEQNETPWTDDVIRHFTKE